MAIPTAVCSPPPQKRTIPNLAANFSWSLFPQNYFQEVLVNICWGINKPQKKDFLGVCCWWIFLSGLFFSIPPLDFLEEGITLCSSFSSSWVPGWVLEEAYRLIKWDHYPPGGFNFGREVYKCNSRFNFLKVISRSTKYWGIQRWQRQGEVGRTVASVICCLGLTFCPTTYPRPVGLHALLGTGDIPVLWWEARVRQCQWSVHSWPGPGRRLSQCELPASM